MQPCARKCLFHPRIGFVALIGAMLTTFAAGCATAPNPAAGKANSNPAEDVPAGKQTSQVAPIWLRAREQTRAVNPRRPRKQRPPRLTRSTKSLQLIPRKVLFGNPDKAMARMSHDAKRLAYLAPVKTTMAKACSTSSSARSTIPTPPSRSRTKKIAPSKATSGPTPTNTSSTPWTTRATKISTSIAVNLDTGETQRHHAARCRQSHRRKRPKRKKSRPKSKASVGAIARGNRHRPQRSRSAISRSLSRRHHHRRQKTDPEKSRLRRLHRRRRLQGPLRLENDARRRQQTFQGRRQRRLGRVI